MKKITIALILGAIFYALSSMVLTPMQASFVGVLAFTIALWTNGGLPMGVVSLLPIVLFSAFGFMEVKAVTANYAKPIIFLFLGGFMLAIAVEKTNLHKYLALKLLSFFPSTTVGLTYAVAITSALLSAVLSNTTITLMLMPIALLLAKDPKVKVRLLLATAYGASMGGILTPVGTPPNLILLQKMEEWGTAAPSFVVWMVMMIPVVAFMLATIPYIIAWPVRKVIIEKGQHKPMLMDKEQKKLSYILIFLFLLLIANAKIEPYYMGLGLNEKLLLLTFGLTMFLPGINFLDWQDTKKIPFEILFLFGAGFSIAAAVIKLDLAQIIIAQFTGIEYWPILLILFATAALVSFTTEVTSNTAFVSLALPIFFELSNAYGLDQRLLIIVTVAASYAFMLPIATPPNAIIMSSGLVEMKTMAKTGFIVNWIGVIILSLVATYFWPFIIG
ncbi:MAG: DASS family sodium-coupled anion symporter [Leptospirales bacterium]